MKELGYEEANYSRSMRGASGVVILIVSWFLTALSIVIVAHLIPGFEVKGFGTALLAALVIGFINATLGYVVKIFALPITVLTFGLFLLVINAFILRFAAYFVSGFVVRGFLPAFVGGIVLVLVNTALRYLVFR